MARKRSSKAKITKTKPAPKRKMAATAKVAAKKKGAAKGKTPPRSRALLNWEIQLRDNYLPAIQNRVNTILLELYSADHNRGPVIVILEDLSDLIGELQSPSSNHEDAMLGYMQEILQIEPSISPNREFQDIPDDPPSSESYAEAMRDDFYNAWNLTWTIYSRMEGEDDRTPPTSSDPGQMILDYAADILKCVDEMNPEFLAIHMRRLSK